MYRENQCAEKDVKVGKADFKVSRYAEEIEADHRNSNAYPHVKGSFLFENEGIDGHENHVKRGYKGCLARIRSAAYSRLLKKAGDCQDNAAYRATDDLGTVYIYFLFLGEELSPGVEKAVKKQYHENKKYKSNTVEADKRYL